MWFEIVCGLVIYKVFRRLIYGGDADDIPDVDSKHSDLSFAVARRLEKSHGGKAYVGLRIPDPDTSSRKHIEIVLVTKREVMVVAVRSFSGFVDVAKDGGWVCSKDGKRSEAHPDPVEEVTKQLIILEAYLEQRGVSLPKGHLIGRVILPNPNCRTSYSVDSQPEVIPFDKWSELKSESKGGLSSWIKDALRVRSKA
ncbi:uncharacterized protein A4U43_C04F14090 [Asparagus officinalis]|uniref:NERD domain-containing protein n=1 Tax=Asparagus officinalis TaxID=4686 RepID=A0A5P1F187_ASPOF|nr:uncharacterized protein A4U43_C04F14090 [Asparagus officinalis]